MYEDPRLSKSGKRKLDSLENLCHNDLASGSAENVTSPSSQQSRLIAIIIKARLNIIKTPIEAAFTPWLWGELLESSQRICHACSHLYLPCLWLACFPEPSLRILVTYSFHRHWLSVLYCTVACLTWHPLFGWGEHYPTVLRSLWHLQPNIIHLVFQQLSTKLRDTKPLLPFQLIQRQVQCLYYSKPSCIWNLSVRLMMKL